MPAIDISEKTECFQALPSPGFLAKFPYGKNIILRTAIVIFTAILACVIPKFGLFINLTGAFACTALAFILPVLMHNSLFDKEIGISRRRLHYFIAAFGTMCGAISFVMSL